MELLIAFIFKKQKLDVPVFSVEVCWSTISHYDKVTVIGNSNEKVKRKHKL